MTPEDLDNYARWYDVDKPWTGGSDVYFHIRETILALQRVLEVHQPYNDRGMYPTCRNCTDSDVGHEHWPCDTVKAVFPK